MATILLRFLKTTRKPNCSYTDYEMVNETVVVGQKMTRKWVIEHYGKDSQDVFYFVTGNKSGNPYGSFWIVNINPKADNKWYVSQLDAINNKPLCDKPYDKIVGKIL